VCIVGAGYTGLWTAYYLKRADPSLRHRDTRSALRGFGASGRNGGWLSGLCPGDRNRMAELYRVRDRVRAWQRALNEAVDESSTSQPQKHRRRASSRRHMQIARNPPRRSRLAAEIDEE